MPYTPPTSDDLAALTTAQAALRQAEDTISDAASAIDIVTHRLSVEVPEPEPCPEPPPPALSLPLVGIGGSGAFAGLTEAKRGQMLSLAKACGITEWRVSIHWAGIERTKGRFTTTGAVALCRQIIDAGLRPMVLVGWAPSFHRQNPTDQNSAPTPASLPYWREFLLVLFNDLYAIGVRRFEIWNEPNFLFMQPVSPELWADLVLIASDVAGEISRHIRIIAGGVCPAVDTPPRSMGASAFYDKVLAHEPEFFRFVDEVGIHPYAGNHTKMKDGQFWTKHVSHIRQLKPVEVPFCGTEHGWKSGVNTEVERSRLYSDTVLNWDEGAPVYLFSMFDFAEKYGLVTAAGEPKPVYTTLQNLLVR